MAIPLISLVIPVLNEADVLPQLLNHLRGVLADVSFRHELVFIDDGSTNATADLLAKAADLNANLVLISLSRRFGKEAAPLGACCA